MFLHTRTHAGTHARAPCHAAFWLGTSFAHAGRSDNHSITGSFAPVPSAIPHHTWFVLVPVYTHHGSSSTTWFPSTTTTFPSYSPATTLYRLTYLLPGRMDLKTPFATSSLYALLLLPLCLLPPVWFPLRCLRIRTRTTSTARCSVTTLPYSHLTITILFFPIVDMTLGGDMAWLGCWKHGT